ncbi:Alcohol dehydrogenase [Paraconexibacter sp. AEG42_29]|uniref:Alcohol dehydrogenase n=1 Tax=Paraconexibacter sp. AEG42_29 TaxID=2997339 RepID=A0AAU7ASL4_9ACTN
MATMRAVQISEAGGPMQLVEREVPVPGAREVRVRVQACGVCHSDVFAVTGGYPGVTFPIVPGHEIAGVIDEVGHDVGSWKVGQRVGVGWFGGNCGHCEPCRRGNFIACQNTGIPGVTFDGGYADHVVVPATALALIPDDLSAEDAAPLLCAGVTTFNALRRSDARGGDTVAVLGVGGLGHLGIQFARRLGFRTVAIARGTAKEELARELGAHHYIDSTQEDPSEALQALGGATVILATASNADAQAAAVGGLAPNGRLIIVGASMDPLGVPPAAFIGGSTGIVGHASGTSQDSQDTLAFSELADVRPMIETMPLEEAQAAYDKMMAGDARFRMVLLTGS